MKTSKKKPSPVLWAFNPFQDSPSVLKGGHESLVKLSKQGGFAPEPVYVVSPTEVNVVLEFSVPAQDRYHTVALRQAEKTLKSLGSGLQPTVLVEKALSLTASARHLAEYAASLPAEAILCSTRAKSGIAQAFLGSFAEALLHQAQSPVLLLPARQRPDGSFRRLFFLSDLSPASQQVFERFCGLASSLKAEVFLFHSIPRPFSWASFAIDALLGPDRLSETQYLNMTRTLREKDLEAFQKTAERHRVKFSSRIEVGGRDVAQDALKAAKKWKADLLGVTGKSGKLKSRILGSITKSLLAQSKIPVWVQHGQ